MRFQDLSPEDQALVQTDFGEFEKEAAAQIELADEMYCTGFSKLASDAADAMDEQAALEKQASQEDDDLDYESEKVASELGAFIERGFFDGLVKEGQERHGNEWHYLVPFMEEKVAQEGAAMAVAKFRKEAAGTGMFRRLANKTKAGARHTKRDLAMLRSHSGAGPVDKKQALKRLGATAAKGAVGGTALGGSGYAGYRAVKGQKKEAGIKDLAGRTGKFVKDYHRNMGERAKFGYEGLRAALTGKGMGINPGIPISKADRLTAAKAGGTNLGLAALRASPHALLAGGGVYGTAKAVKNRKNKGE